MRLTLGDFSLLKCAICSRKCTSCRTIGPSGPIVSELRSLDAGAPVLVVEPIAALKSDMVISRRIALNIGHRTFLFEPYIGV